MCVCRLRWPSCKSAIQVLLYLLCTTTYYYATTTSSTTCRRFRLKHLCSIFLAQNLTCYCAYFLAVVFLCVATRTGMSDTSWSKRKTWPRCAWARSERALTSGSSRRASATARLREQREERHVHTYMRAFPTLRCPPPVLDYWLLLITQTASRLCTSNL